VKYLLLLDSNETEYYRLIFKKCSNIKFKNSHPKGAELFHADCWTDRERDMIKSVTFHNFANAPKKAWISSKGTYLPCVKVKPTKGR